MTGNKLFLAIILLVGTLPCFAQSSTFKTNANIGISTPILDNGLGFQVGLNPSLRLNRFLSVEGQVSYNFTKTTGSFISGNTGSSNSANLLGGARLYLAQEERTIRPYLNMLLGLNYLKEELNGTEFEGQIDAGISTGLFLEFKKVLIGVSFDSPQYLNLKVGYAL